MIKLPFSYVSGQVDKLYDKQIDTKDPNALDAHCEFIEAFILGCGWTVDQYTRAMFGFQDLDKLN